MASHNESEETDAENSGKPTTNPANNEDLNAAAEEIFSVGQSVFAQSEAFLESLLRPWNAYQFGIATA